MVKNRWDENQSLVFQDVLSQRVYSSRLLGSDPSLVLHGGGNTSAKSTRINLHGNKEDILYIKGSGWDLSTIEAPGFAAVRLDPLKKARDLSTLSDPDMVNLLRTELTDFTMPTPSVEALLHAFIPEIFVDHTHADAVLTLTNQPNGEEIIKTLYETRIGIVPYVMPGFALAKLCAEIYDKSPGIEGLILLKHGVFSFGKTAKESYERMINLVNRAETFIDDVKTKTKSQAHRSKSKLGTSSSLSSIYAELSRRGFQSVLHLEDDDQTLEFVNRSDVSEISQRGPVTPDHVIRTKRIPLVLKTTQDSFDIEFSKKLDEYRDAYQVYFNAHSTQTDLPLTMLDPFPRLILIPGLGLVTVGKTKKEATIAADIYQRSMGVILNAEIIGKYDALPQQDIFDVEYWVLEQAKLNKAKSSTPFLGKTILVTGGSRGIGKAVCQSYAAHSTQVFNLDLQPPNQNNSQVHYIEADVSDEVSISNAFDEAVKRTGKIDIVIINAGIFPESQSIKDLSSELWQKSLNINLNGAFYTARAAAKWLSQNPRGGDIIFVASKNVPAPGKKAAAYSVMKAAQTQLARVLALESGSNKIRVNIVHPNMIFDTDIWSDEIIVERAKAYQMTPEAYKKNNCLNLPLSSQDVADVILALTSGAFSKSTGLQIPIDGGNERVI
jgi:rhamnose utilization protein RhaD (predicted bifunctional aldolase and dehydrogenase)/NAD(P)-dependent dehydrogenase (short-subunit alcohol dehydrogenase family)